MADIEQNSQNTAKIVYLLFLANILVPFLSLIGVVVAYVNRSDAPVWLQSHYQFQIRTFWIGLLYFFVGILLATVLIGYLVLIFWLVWLIIRCVKGLKYLSQQQPHPHPTSWLFS
jgi:uncharacterized membrane protein